MSFNFLNLSDEVRELMLSEVEFDVKTNNLYFSKSFSDFGNKNYLELLKQSIKTGNEETLGQSLKNKGFFVETKTNVNGVVSKTPITAPLTFSEGEFNRFYMRAVCLKAIDEEKEVEVYRAKEVSNPRSESEAKVGEKLNPENLLEDLRKNIGVDTSLGLPTGPNSGLSINIVS